MVSPDPNGVIWLDATPSTNDAARALVDRPDVQAVAADTQTAGRGRRGRAWQSPPGSGLYMTWIARPTWSVSDAALLPLMAAVATAEVVRDLGAAPTFKWPNDLWLEGRKLAGILCEAASDGRGWHARVGIGLNVRTPPDGWPAEVPGIALDAVVDPVPAPRALVAPMLGALERWAHRVERDGGAPVIAAWRVAAPPTTQRLRQGEVSGTWAGITDDGALRLRADDGTVHVVRAGDVELVAWS